MGTHIGQHITELRKIRRLSVRQLATRINVSVSSLEKYERGSRTVPSGLIAKLAQALAVGPERITGQPYLNGVESDEQIQAVIPDLRRIMITYDSPDAPTRAPRPLAALATEAESVARLRQDGRSVVMGSWGRCCPGC
ncbi:helix-turn-helix transcriptional regulator [Streptomyces sp. HSW2009]|uniref:helix-turn-helix domain-containing protein n=1 Tax=Streptomyces sp. HSW2009 TaxID=3142890 RepID=UPI0032EF1F1D